MLPQQPTRQNQNPEAARVWQQISCYHTEYHNKLQSEVRRPNFNREQVERCNVIMRSCRFLMNMELKGNLDADLFRQHHQAMMQAIQEYEAVASGIPPIRVHPPTPRPATRGENQQGPAGARDGDVFL